MSIPLVVRASRACFNLEEIGMSLIQKLVHLRECLLLTGEAAGQVLEELSPPESESESESESEVLLTRSKLNRRSEKNEVLAMVPLNGAPSVPESWKLYTRSKETKKYKAWIYRVLKEYEPMSRKELCMMSISDGVRTRDMGASRKFSNAWHACIHGLLQRGQIRLNRGKVVLGQE